MSKIKLKMPTRKQVLAAAAKSDKAALEVSIKKYDYFRNLQKIRIDFGECALCRRHSSKGDCPLQKDCDVFCINDFGHMHDMCYTGNLVGFKKYADRIYKKLVKALVKLEKMKEVQK